MMKLIMFFFVLSLSGNLTEIRNLYSNVSSSKEKQQDFITYMQKADTKKPVFQAYKGAALILQSKNTTVKSDRKQLFVNGAGLIDKSVNKEPENIEIRLIRLSIQENIPKALKYNSNIQEDVTFINKNLNHIKDSELKSYVQRYVKQSKSFK